jgi:hypothetical protein
LKAVTQVNGACQQKQEHRHYEGKLDDGLACRSAISVLTTSGH